MKKLFLTVLSVVLILSVAFSLTGCAFFETLAEGVGTVFSKHEKGIPEENDFEYEQVEKMVFSCSPYYTPLTSRYSYNLLSDGEKALYDELLDSIYVVYPEENANAQYKTKQVILDGVLLSEAQIRTAIKAIYDDNPYIFWMSNTFGHLMNEAEGYTAVQLYSNDSPEGIRTRLQELDACAGEFYDSLPEGLSAYEIEKTVHDFIIDTCDYDHAAAAPQTFSDSNPDSFTPYGAIVNHKAVCEGYARGVQFLLNGLGVECVGIIGMAQNSGGEEELHMWDAVKIASGWYYLDPTWDDQEDEIYRYDYFNLTSKQLSDDHELSPLFSTLTDEEICGGDVINASSMNIFVPDCTLSDYNYYCHECVHLTDYDGKAVKDALYDAALIQEERFCIYIDPIYLDFDEAVRVTFSQSPQYFFSYLEETNHRLYYYSLDTSNVSLFQNKKLFYVTVELNYV